MWVVCGSVECRTFSVSSTACEGGFDFVFAVEVVIIRVGSLNVEDCLVVKLLIHICV